MYNESNFFEGPIEIIETFSDVFLQDLHQTLMWCGFSAMRAHLLEDGFHHGPNYVYPIKVFISGQPPVVPYVVCHVVSDSSLGVYFTPQYHPTILPQLAGAPTLLLTAKMFFKDREE